jgi:hypothetical protein
MRPNAPSGSCLNRNGAITKLLFEPFAPEPVNSRQDKNKWVTWLGRGHKSWERLRSAALASGRGIAGLPPDRRPPQLSRALLAQLFGLSVGRAGLIALSAEFPGGHLGPLFGDAGGREYQGRPGDMPRRILAQVLARLPRVTGHGGPRRLDALQPPVCGVVDDPRATHSLRFPAEFHLLSQGSRGRWGPRYFPHLGMSPQELLDVGEDQAVLAVRGQGMRIVRRLNDLKNSRFAGMAEVNPFFRRRARVEGDRHEDPRAGREL